MNNIPADALGNYGGTADMPSVPDVNLSSPNVSTGPKKTMSFNDIYQQSLDRAGSAKVESVPLSSIQLGNRYKSVVPFEDTEEMYAQQQGIGSKWLNAALKTAGTFTNSFVGGTAGLVWGVGEAIATQRLAAIADNAVNRKVDDITTGLEDVLPNYYTQREITSDAISTDNLLSANFWSNKGLQNLGFAAGALVGGGVWSKILKSLGGLNSMVLAGRGMETATAIEEAMSAVPNASKYTAFDGALNSVAKKFGVNPIAQTLKQSERLTISTLASFGEGSIEAVQKMKQFKEKLTDDFVLKYGRQPQDEELQQINNYTDNVGKYVLAGNLMLLSATNYLQLPKILGSSRRFDKALINQVEQKELGGAWSSVISGGVKKFGKRAYNAAGLLFSPSEAFEEAGQYAIQEGVASYFNKAYKNQNDSNDTLSKIYGSMNNVLGEGWDKVFTDKDGLESLILGGVSGGMQQSGIVGTYKNDKGQTRLGIGKSGEIAERGWFGEGGERASNTDAALKALGQAKIKDQLQTQAKYLAIAIGSQQERQEAILDNNKLQEKDSEHDYVMSYVMPRVLYGKEESIYQELDSYSRQAVTQEGFDELISSGIVAPNEKQPAFIERIANLKNLTQSVVDTYENIKDKYSDIVNKDGKRLYDDDVIEKMIYATAKINNYDQRIPNVNQDLTVNGIPTFDLLGKIIDGKATPKQAYVEGVAAIDALDIAPNEKDDLKLDLHDLIEMSLRRKRFVDEYKEIKGQPEKWKSSQAKTSAQDVINQESQKPTVAPPVAAQESQATPTAELPLPTTGDVNPAEGEVMTQPAAQQKATVSFLNKNGQEETLEEGREYVNKGWNERDILHKFKVVKVNEDGTVDAELVDGSISRFNPQLFAGAERVRDGRDAIVDNAQEIKDIQDALEDKSDFSTGFEVDEYIGDKEPSLPSADRLFFRTKTASSRDYPNGLPINITRYNEFTNNVDSFSNRKNIRFVYVTPNQQDALGLNKLAELSYMKGPEFVTTPEWLESITGVEKGLVMAVFVEQDGGNLFLIDKDGKRIKNQDGSDAVLGNPNNNFDIKQTIFSTTPTTAGEGRSSDDPKVVDQFRESWKQERATLFANQYKPGDPIDSYEFDLSKGFAVRTLGEVQHNSVASVFDKIKQSVITGMKGLIEVSTLGYIVHKNGMSYKFAVGRPVLKYGDKLEYLQNDKITPNQAVTIVEVLKKLHDVFVDTSMSKEQKIKENTKLLTYIKAVLFWSSKKVTGNSFYINYNTGNINIAGTDYDFSDIEGRRNDIIGALSTVYSNTSNELLTKYFDEPFYEQVWNGKELTERKWKNYQAYLLSDVMPDNKTKRTTAPPLTVNITVPTPAVPYAYEQKYAFPTNFKLTVPQAPASQVVAPEVVIDPVSKSTGYKTDGTPNKIIFKGIQFTFTHNGKEATVDFSSDFINGEELIEGVKKLMEGNAQLESLGFETVRSTVMGAAAKHIDAVMAEQIAATPVAVVAPEVPTQAIAPVKDTPKGTLTKFSILGEDNRFRPENANPGEKNVYYGVDEEGDVFMLAPESYLPKMIYDFKPYIGRLYNITVPEGMKLAEGKGVLITELPKVDSQGNLIKKGKLIYTDRSTIKYDIQPAAATVAQVPVVNKIGQLQDLDEVLKNYQLDGDFGFISPILKTNNIQVSYDAAHMGGNLPKVASIDTDVVDGKYRIILTINKSTFDTKSATEQKYIIAHEFTHGLIKVKLNEKGDLKGTELYKGLTDIYQSVEDYFHKGVSGIDKEAAFIITDNFSKPQIAYLRQALDYIAKSPEEMATMGLTDPDMIKFLKLIPGTAPAYTKKSLFAQLADMISKFLGLSNSKFNDLLTFMSEQLEQASAAPNSQLGFNTAQDFLDQPITPKQSRKTNGYPVFPELSAEQKYYLVEDFKAKFYLTLFKDNQSLFNVDTNSANTIFKTIVDSYKKNDAQYTDEQYMEIIDATKRQLANLYISFHGDEVTSVNDESASDRLYAPEAFSVDLKKSTPFAIKILTSSLVKTDGKQSEDPRFLPKAQLHETYKTIQLIPEGEVYSALVNKLVNIKNTDDFIKKLHQIALSNADYVQLFVRLGGNMVTGQVDLVDNSDFRLFVSAMQTYTKAKPEMFIQYFKEDSTFRGAADLTNGAKQVEKRWINNMIASSKIESSVIKYNSGEKQFEANVGNPDISTPENMIDFLNKIGITFTPSIYNKLNESQKDKFGKAAIKIKADLTSAEGKGIVTLKKGKFKTLGNGISRLADLFTAVEMPNQNNSLYNAEGKRINSLTESNAPSLFEYQFNSIMNLSEIEEKMPQLKDVFSQSSEILKEGGPIFNEDGERRLDEFGNPVELKVQVISGEIDTDENKGGGVSGMSQANRYITEINQNINGSYYILVPADSSTEWMINLGNRISYKQFAEGRGYQDAIEILNRHLDADIELALDAENREVLKNVGKKGKDLRFFKDILSQDLLNELTGLIDQRVKEEITEEDFRIQLQDIKTKNSEKINKNITDYLNEGRDKVVKTLQDLKLVKVVGEDKNGETMYSFTKLDAAFQEDVKRISNINTNSMSLGELRIIAEFLSTNYVLNNIEFHKVLFGDPYQFAIKNKNGKTILEETKRVKMFLSPRKFSVDFPALNNWLNESNNEVEVGEDEFIQLDDKDFGYHENKSHINVAVIKDVIIEGGLYPGVNTNEADAFSYQSPGFYREVKTKNAQWSDVANDFHNWQMAYARQKLAAKEIYKGYGTKPALKKHDAELIATPRPSFITDVMKPVVSGDKFGKVTIDLVGHKMSQMPLYYEAVENTALEDVFIKMFNENIDYIVMESGGKVGTEEVHELYKEGKINDEPFNNKIQVPFKSYGIQVETGYKDKKGTTLGSQGTKIATVDLYSGGEAIGDDPARQQIIKDAVERHDNALKRLYTEAADSLLNDFGIEFEDDGFVLRDKTKVANVLKQELITEDASDNLIASLEINPETNDFVTPLESSPNYMQIVRLLYSVIHKRIVSPKVNGMSAVQIPVTGWEDLSKGRKVVEINGKKVLTDSTLKFYEDKDENGVNMRYCEILVTLPTQARELFSDKTKFPNEDAIVDYLNKQSPDSLMVIGFRIPTQGLNSMERIKIKGILPEFMGTTVVVPSEITTKAGSDFDIDKLNMYMKALYKDALGNIQSIEYKGSEEETKQFYGEIFDQLNDREQRYISKQMDEADYEDIDLIEKLISKQEKLNDKIADRQKYVDKMYRQAIENEYYSSIDTLLGLPENFKRLTTPNSTNTLMEIAEEMDGLTGYDESTIKNRILDRTYMSFLRHAFITGKNWIGISATATTGHSLAQKAGLFVDHVFKMSLPHNKTADGKVDLSQRFFTGTKEYISDILSEYTSSFADAGNDPFIFKLIYSNQVVSSFMFLARAGVNPRQAALFMNQPIIRDFVTTADANGKYVLTEMTAEDSTLIEEIESKYRTSKAAAERTTEINIDTLDKNIGVKLTEDQNAEQLLILREFYSIAKAANGLFIITEATNYDTAKFSNADDFRRKQMKTLTQYTFANDSFRISSAKNLLDKSHLRTLVNALTKANRGLGTILRFNTPSYRAVINKVIDTYAVNDFISKEKFSKIANKLSGSLLDYIIQTNTNFDVAGLVYGKDSVITKFQEAVKSHPNMKILQDLEVIPGKTIVAPSTIALKVSPETAADKNRYTEGFRELRDNPETNDLYKKLVKLAIVQGTYKTSASFKEVVPVEDISTEITKAINMPGVEERLMDFYKNARFQRTNFNDSAVAPRVNPPMNDVPEGTIETPWGTEIDLYSFTSAISFSRQGAESARDLIGLHLKSKGAAYDFVTMTRAIPTKSGDMVDFETGYTIQATDYAVEMQKDESIYNKVYGYQKVKYPNGTPVKIKMEETSREQYVYKLVNLYGDGKFLTEYHNTLQKSELKNGTVKVDKEYSDDAIIKALDRQGKLVGYSETASVAPVVQPSITVVDRYTDADVKANPNTIYVFGDNTKRTGTGGQAQIRNNPNAMGIATKLAPSMDDSAFMTDLDLASNKSVIDSDIAKIKATGKSIVLPKDGFGTGLAKLKEKAPQTFAYLNQRLLQEFGFNNEGEVTPQPIAEVAPIEEKSANIEILEKLEMAKNKLEAFEFSPEGIFYNYFRSGARIKPGSFDRLVDRNKRSASTNGAYTSTQGAYSYDSLARQAYEASNMEVDDTFAVEALEEFLSNYPDTWKTPYNNIVDEIKDLENQLKSIEKSTEKVVSSQLSLFDDNQPEGLPAIDRSPENCNS